tara:strand:- start:98 stop:508 length:411 start_codon:yes stop_codon:yes gene_type:complete
MYEIIPDLWISKTKAVNIVNCVHFNCSKDLTFLGKHKAYNPEIKKNIIKYELLELYKYTLQSIERIHRSLLENQTVVISCNSCSELSPLIAIAYIIKYSKLNKINAIELFKTKKETIVTEGVYFNHILDKISRSNI